MDAPVMHLYGVLPAEADRDLGPIGPHRVEVVAQDGLGIALTRGPRWNPAGMARAALIARLAAHQAVLEALMATADVIPIRFGTQVSDSDEVRRLLRAGRWTFGRALERFGGQAEFEVVAYWRDLEAVLASLASLPEVARLRQELAERPFTLEDKLRLGRLVSANLEALRADRAARIAQRLSALTAVSKAQAIVDQAQILGLSLLLPRTEEERLNRELRRLDSEHEDTVNLRLIGPLPPHSFCTLQIGRPDPARLEWACQRLGLPGALTGHELQTAYRRTVAAEHPDRGGAGPEAQGRFREVQEAHRTLSEFLAHVRISVTPPPDLFIIDEHRAREPALPGLG